MASRMEDIEKERKKERERDFLEVKVSNLEKQNKDFLSLLKQVEENLLEIKE
jgi:hypothetical protein